MVSERLAPRTHIQTDQELREGRTRFTVRREWTTETVPFLDIRNPDE